jgi:hypothetical protein
VSELLAPKVVLQARSFDLFYDAVFKSEWPTLDWSIKSLAKFLKFKWRDADPSGAASIERQIATGRRNGYEGLRPRIREANRSHASGSPSPAERRGKPHAGERRHRGEQDCGERPHMDVWAGPLAKRESAASGGGWTAASQGW